MRWGEAGNGGENAEMNGKNCRMDGQAGLRGGLWGGKCENCMITIIQKMQEQTADNCRKRRNFTN